MRRLRFATWLLLAAAMIAAAPALRADDTSFDLTAPSPGPAAGEVAIRWEWSGGTEMRDRTVTLSLMPNGVQEFVIATVPIWHGVYFWDTGVWSDARYILRGRVDGMPLESYIQGVVVDNTDPEVAITRPLPGDVVAADQVVATGAPETVVVGAVTLVAEATDGRSGVASVTWSVDGTDIGQGSSVEHVFEPGRHTVTATALDAAGNASEATIELVALAVEDPAAPGAGETPDGSTEEEDQASPSPLPSPEPSGTPDPGPGLPDPGSLPLPVPSALPSL